MGRPRVHTVKGSEPLAFMIIEDASNEPDGIRGQLHRTQGPMTEDAFRAALVDGGMSSEEVERMVAVARNHPVA